MHAHDGPSSCFWQRKWAVNLHVTHNYTELYQILPKFLFQAEELQPMQLLFVQKPFQKKKGSSLLPCSGPFQILIHLRGHFINRAGTAFPYVHHFTYIYIAFHLSFYCPVTQSLQYFTVCPCPASLNNFVSSAYFLTLLPIFRSFLTFVSEAVPV